MSTSTYYSFIPTAQAARDQQIKRQQAADTATAAAIKSSGGMVDISIRNSNNNTKIDRDEARRQTAMSPASLATASSSSNSNSSLNQFNSLTPVSSASSTTTVSSSTSSSSSATSSSFTTSSSSSSSSSSATNASSKCNVVVSDDNTRTDLSTKIKLIDPISLRRQSSSATPTQSTSLIMSPEQSHQLERLQERDHGNSRSNNDDDDSIKNRVDLTTRTPSSLASGAIQRIRRTTSPQLFHSYTLYSLEPKPLKPFKSRSDYLEAMKEDLAEWLNTLYTDLDLNVDNFFSQLETGTIICRHANNVTQFGRNSMLATQTDQLSSGSTQAQSNTNVSNSQSSSTSKHHANNTTANNQNDDECQINRSNNSIKNNSNISLLNSPSPDSGDHSIMSSYSSSNRSSCIPNSQYNHQHYNNQSNYTQQQLNQSFISDCSSLPFSSPLSLSPIPNNRDVNSSFLLRTNSSSSNNSSNHDNRSTINWYRVKMIPYKQNVRAGTFFARDNICQFILWCRSLNIHECLLFETDDLVARKNEKSFILCLLEVARIGCKVGMPTPLIIQLEQEIDKEIENDAKLQRQLELDRTEELELRDDVLSDNQDQNGATENSSHNFRHKEYCYIDNKSSILSGHDSSDKGEHISTDKKNTPNEDELETDGNEEFGPKPQVITNDLLTLHERVVQLLCQCTCATQFPMVRIGDGKYKVGDKMIIFVRILRRHIMVRVGGGWQEFSEFLRQKDPCRTKNQFGGSNQIETNGSQCGNGIANGMSQYTTGSTHYLNKYSHTHHNHHQRHQARHRLISGSASMDWLSHNA